MEGDWLMKVSKKTQFELNLLNDEQTDIKLNSIVWTELRTIETSYTSFYAHRLRHCVTFLCFYGFGRFGCFSTSFTMLFDLFSRNIQKMIAITISEGFKTYSTKFRNVSKTEFTLVAIRNLRKHRTLKTQIRLWQFVVCN